MVIEMEGFISVKSATPHIKATNKQAPYAHLRGDEMVAKMKELAAIENHLALKRDRRPWMV